MPKIVIVLFVSIIIILHVTLNDCTLAQDSLHPQTMLTQKYYAHLFGS
jgi:hypothetical protein